MVEPWRAIIEGEASRHPPSPSGIWQEKSDHLVVGAPSPTSKCIGDCVLVVEITDGKRIGIAECLGARYGNRPRTKSCES